MERVRILLAAAAALLLAGCASDPSPSTSGTPEPQLVQPEPVVLAEGTYVWHPEQAGLFAPLTYYNLASQTVANPCLYEGRPYFNNFDVPTGRGGMGHLPLNGTLSLTLDTTAKGEDVTVVATGRLVHEALAAAEQAEEQGVSVEVVDPRTLQPLDEATIVDSVKKTNRCVVAHEAIVRMGFGAEVAAVVQEQAFDYLDAPVQRVGAKLALMRQLRPRGASRPAPAPLR